MRGSAKRIKTWSLKGVLGLYAIFYSRESSEKIMDHDMEVGFVFWFMGLIVGDPDSRP